MTHILIPREPSMNLLRPFIECPTSELDQAWAAMVRIAEVQHARAGRQGGQQIEVPPQSVDIAINHDTEDLAMHSLSTAPAAVAGPAWDKTRDSLATLLLGLARRPFLDFDVACIALDSATEPGMPLAYMRGAPAAPALEAPAAPATSAQVQALHRARRALHAIGKTYDDSELRTRALEADEEIDRMLAAAPQAPADLQAAPVAWMYQRHGSDFGAWFMAAGQEADDLRVGRPNIMVPCPNHYGWTALYAAPQAPAAPVKYVPVDSRLRDSNWRHPNDDELRTEACRAALRERGDDEGQGLDGYWKWGFAAGFNAALAAPAAPAVDASDTARMDWLLTKSVSVREPMRDGPREIFWAGPVDRAGMSAGPSDLRARIDATQAAAKGAA